MVKGYKHGNENSSKNGKKSDRRQYFKDHADFCGSHDSGKSAPAGL